MEQNPLQGLKPEITAPISGVGSNPSPGFYLLQMAIVLLIVVGLLKWAMPKWLLKLKGKLNVPESSSIKIEESASFASGTLYVVSVRNKTLLLCASNQGVTCLADLTNVSQEGSSPKQKPDTAAFFEMLDQQKQKLENQSRPQPPEDFRKTFSTENDYEPEQKKINPHRKTASQKKDIEQPNSMRKEDLQSAIEKLNRLIN